MEKFYLNVLFVNDELKYAVTNSVANCASYSKAMIAGYTFEWLTLEFENKQKYKEYIEMFNGTEIVFGEEPLVLQ